MPLHQVTVWTVTCNGCGGEMFGGANFGEAWSARNMADQLGWYIGADLTALCPDCDGENE